MLELRLSYLPVAITRAELLHTPPAALMGRKTSPERLLRMANPRPDTMSADISRMKLPAGLPALPICIMDLMKTNPIHVNTTALNTGVSKMESTIQSCIKTKLVHRLASMGLCVKRFIVASLHTRECPHSRFALRFRCASFAIERHSPEQR